MKHIFFLLPIVILVGCNSLKPEKTDMQGKTIPSFNLLLPDSTTYFNTNGISIGKPVVLFCFGPRCPYSHAQMKEIIEDINNLKNIQFYIFTPYPFKEMKWFYMHYQLGKYRNITTGFDYKNFFADYFKVKGVPYMAIYGKDKKLKESFIGKLYSTQIKEVAE